ncbi:MAG: RsiV family protein [Paludibacter sp.]|nr:RsiV family protein [Paludibacter sp.]
MCSINSYAQNEKDFIAVDSVIVNDSVKIGKNLFYHFDYSLLVFPTINNKELLDNIYKPANIQANNYSKQELLAAIKENQKNEIEDIGEYDIDDEECCDSERSFYMTIFSKNNNLLTVNYADEGYVTGAAHGWYGIFYRVFDLKENKKILNTDIFKDVESKDLSKILLKYFNEENLDVIDCLFDTIPINDNFYFDEKSITFVYNQYEIMPYVCGMAEITIPFDVIKVYLEPEFVKKYIIQ